MLDIRATHYIILELSLAGVIAFSGYFQKS
jgi:hypothetical protein